MMKKNLSIIISFALIFLAQGCILMHSVSYEVKPDGNGGGTAVLTVEDIRSDALNAYELKEDKKNLFEFMYKSDDFIEQMKDEGKTINSRELFVENGKLNGIIKFNFTDIEIVEGIVYEDPFYFLTLSPEDSIISTNGEVVVSDKYKRIMWDNTVKVLKFKMFSDVVENGNLVSMAQYYESD
jgi:sulfur carrier protein ThiS